MPRRNVRTKVQRAIFFCVECEHPMEEWFAQGEILTNDKVRGEKKFNEPFSFCPSCGAKNWFPAEYTRH